MLSPRIMCKPNTTCSTPACTETKRPWYESAVQIKWHTRRHQILKTLLRGCHQHVVVNETIYTFVEYTRSCDSSSIRFVAWSKPLNTPCTNNQHIIKTCNQSYNEVSGAITKEWKLPRNINQRLRRTCTLQMEHRTAGPATIQSSRWSCIPRCFAHHWLSRKWSLQYPPYTKKQRSTSSKNHEGYLILETLKIMHS